MAFQIDLEARARRLVPLAWQLAATEVPGRFVRYRARGGLGVGGRAECRLGYRPAAREQARTEGGLILGSLGAKARFIPAGRAAQTDDWLLFLSA